MNEQDMNDERLSVEKVEEIIEQVEAEVLAEDKLGASRNDVVEGTCQRIVRRLRMATDHDEDRRDEIERFNSGECPRCHDLGVVSVYVGGVGGSVSCPVCGNTDREVGSNE